MKISPFPHIIACFLILALLNTRTMKGNACKCGGKKAIELEEYAKEIDGRSANPFAVRPKLVISAKKAKILSNEPDSLITCLKKGKYDFPGHPNAQCLVVKDVFSTEYFLNKQIDVQKKTKMAKNWSKFVLTSMALFPREYVYGKIAKPMFMLAHELDIFELFGNGREQGSPVARLYKGVKRNHSVMFIMELGVPLPTHLKKLNKKWKDDYKQEDIGKINAEIEDLIKEIARTLEKFHKKALHLHLKPGNWIYGKNNDNTADGTNDSAESSTENDNQQKALKLIDFQTALPIDRRNDEVPIKHLIEFACNSLWNEEGWAELSSPMTASERPSTYASPEHKLACRNAKMASKEKEETKLKEALEMITKASDIWSMGVLIVEILAQNPALLKKAKVFGMRTKLWGCLTCKALDDEKIAETFVELRAFFAEDHLNLTHNRQSQLAISMGEIVQADFPRIYKLLKMIFNKNQGERPTLEYITSK